MKKTLLALLALSGAASAEISSLDVLNETYGTLIGSRSNTATEATTAFGPASTYTDLKNLLNTENVWYVTNNYVEDLDVYKSTRYNNLPEIPTDTVTIVAGGPSANSASGAIKFTLNAETIAQYEGAITLTFDVALHEGNNRQNHAFTFALMGNLEDSDFKTSITYNSKSGNNLLTTTDTKVELSMSAEQVEAMQTAGTDQTLVLLAATDQVTGSNRSVTMKNFALEGQKNVPEPATAALSLLALAGLAARRRRK